MGRVYRYILREQTGSGGTRVARARQPQSRVQCGGEADPVLREVMRVRLEAEDVGIVRGSGLCTSTQRERRAVSGARGQ